MKVITTVLVCLFFLMAGVCMAADIDGKWVSERKIDRNGETLTIVQTFDLKADAGKLAGTVTIKFGDMEPMKADISEGKIDGNKFSFAVVMSTPNGDFKSVYDGTVEGDTLKGNATREGAQARPFEAKRSK